MMRIWIMAVAVLVALAGVALATGNDSPASNSLGQGECEFITFSAGGTLCEGAVEDSAETFLTFFEPTADRTIRFPDASGTVCVSGQTCAVDVSGTAAEASTLTGNYVAELYCSGAVTGCPTPGVAATIVLDVPTPVRTATLADTPTLVPTATVAPTATLPNYAGSASQGGAAATGDSATAFFASGTLECAVGGTGTGCGTDDQVLISNGTVAQWRSLPLCTGAAEALRYDTATNSASCGTVTASAGSCTSTAGAVQYDNAGALGCTGWVWSSGAMTSTGDLIVKLDSDDDEDAAFRVKDSDGASVFEAHETGKIVVTDPAPAATPGVSAVIEAYDDAFGGNIYYRGSSEDGADTDCAGLIADGSTSNITRGSFVRVCGNDHALGTTYELAGHAVFVAGAGRPTQTPRPGASPTPTPGGAYYEGGTVQLWTGNTGGSSQHSTVQEFDGDVTFPAHLETHGDLPSVNCNGTVVETIDTQSTDVAGRVTFASGGSGTTSCTITFAKAFDYRPSCWCSRTSNNATWVASTTATTLTCDTGSTFNNSSELQYGCLGYAPRGLP